MRNFRVDEPNTCLDCFGFGSPRNHLLEIRKADIGIMRPNSRGAQMNSKPGT